MKKSIVTLINLILALVVAYLAICWINDPKGNWEPWTVLVTAIIALINYRKEFISFFTAREVKEEGISIEESKRRAYLKNLQKDIQNKIKSSIHSARFIDLGISDSPISTHLPWRYKDSNDSQEFSDLEAAFKAYNGRMLLLGEPGAGKTTTMLHIADQLITIALADPAAPIPLIVNLSKFKFDLRKSLFNHRFSKEETGDRQDSTEIERWLVAEFIRYPDITSTLASKWIREGRVAAFLDGLDEVDDQRRAKLVDLLNDTYLRRYQQTKTIVCSRINEYLPFQEVKEKRLQLDGAVTLQKLTDEEIKSYLVAAECTGILKTLPEDETLQEMVRTPLILSMMTLAYGSTTPDTFDKELTLTERRHKLLEAYVRKMLQRGQRRERGIPFDDNPDNDVPQTEYKYSEAKVNQYLGWLALRMSTRMQTAFSFDKYYDFLIADLYRDKKSSIWWTTALTRGVLVFLFVLMTFYILDFLRFHDVFTICKLAGLIGVGAATGEWVRSVFADERFSNSGVDTVLRVGIVLVVFLICFFGGMVMVSLSLAELFPTKLPATIYGTLFLLVAFWFWLGIDSLKSGKVDHLLRKSFLSILINCILIAIFILFSQYSIFNEWIGFCLMIGLIFFNWLLVVFYDENIREIESFKISIYVLVGLTVLVGIANYGVYLIEEIKSFSALFFHIFYMLILASVYRFSLSPILTLFLCSIICFSLGSFSGLVLAAFVHITFIYLVEDVLKPDEEFKKERKAKYYFQFYVPLIKLISDRESTYFLSPMLRKLNGIFTAQPLWDKRFYSHCQQRLLLKYSTGDFEFTHRLLRDYFSLRELQPGLHSTNMKLKIESIRNLGFQGDAGIDALIEFSKHRNTRIRAAAQWAFGRIASPTVVQYIKLGLRDKKADIRLEALRSANHSSIEKETYKEILHEMMKDTVTSVQTEALLSFLKLEPHKRLRGEEWVLFTESPDFKLYLANKLMKQKKFDSNLITGFCNNRFILSDQLFVLPLIHLASKSPDKDDKIRFIITIGSIGDRRALAPLKKLLKKSKKSVKAACIEAIEIIEKKNGIAAKKDRKG